MPVSAAMAHITGDFNLGSLIRSANFFGLKEVYYIGGKKSFDRRSTVGTHHYTPTNHIKTEEEFLSIIDTQDLVCIENNIPEFEQKITSIFNDNVFIDLINPVFLFGEEQKGISTFLLEKCKRIITIPAYGSVRSMNVGCCASTIFSFYRKHYNNTSIIS